MCNSRIYENTSSTIKESEVSRSSRTFASNDRKRHKIYCRYTVNSFVY